MTVDPRNNPPGVGYAVEWQQAEYSTSSAVVLAENVLRMGVNRDLLYRYVACYIEVKASDYTVDFNWFLRGQINFYLQGRPVGRLPIVAGHQSSALADIVKGDSLVNVFDSGASSPRQWKILLADKFRASEVIIKPASLLMASDELSVSILGKGINTVSMVGYRLLLCCLSSSHPLP